MSGAKSKSGGSPAIFIVFTAIMAALLVAGKYSLALIANVEVVTVFIIVFASAFGYMPTMIAVNVFCALDPIIYPKTMSFPSIIIGYFLYWNLLCLLSYLIHKSGVRSPLVYALFAFFMSFIFGALMAACQSIVAGVAFVPLYAAGILFDVIHMVSNFAIVLVLYKPLSVLLKKIAPQRL